jgi:peptidoglycan/LPS O-acetylase OafA/YrhL
VVRVGVGGIKMKSSNRIEFLDYVRGIAILSVFLFHSLQESFYFSTLPWYGWLHNYSHVPKTFLALLPASFGWAGVSVFFVVSGFCIHLSFHKQGREWRSFFIRRFFRIYPPYFFALLLFAAIFSMTTLGFELGSFPRNSEWRQLFAHLFLVHNFDPVSYSTINTSFWTIAVEAQLYLLYPILLLMVAKLGWRRTMILVAACELSIDAINGVFAGMIGAEELSGFHLPRFAFTISPWVHWFAISPLGYWFSWSLGAFVADAFLKERTLPFAKSSIALWLLLIGMSYFVRPFYPFFFPLVALLTATIIGKVLSGTLTKVRVPDFCLEHLRKTGLRSYSIYLLHQPIIAISVFGFVTFFPVMMDYPLLKFSFCIILWFVIWALGGLWYRLLELPSIALGKLFIKKQKSPVI